MERNKSDLNTMTRSLFSISNERFRSEREELKHIARQLEVNSRNTLKERLQKLQFSEEKLELLSPQNILKRGYSITRQNGKAIRQPEEVDPNKVLETTVYGGKIFSQIQKTEKNSDHEQ